MNELKKARDTPAIVMIHLNLHVGQEEDKKIFSPRQLFNVSIRKS